MKIMKTYKIQTRNREVFWSADQHYFHGAMITHGKRPADINETMISNHNSVVREKDIIIYVGDFSFGHPKQTEELLVRLNGHHIVVPGDHDNIFGRISPRDQKSGRWLFDLRPPILKLSVDNQQIVNCHYLMTVWPKSHYNSWHVYAHVHGHLEGVGKTHDVGVENNDFYPISFTQLKKIMEAKPDNFNYIKPEDRQKWNKKK